MGKREVIKTKEDDREYSHIYLESSSIHLVLDCLRELGKKRKKNREYERINWEVLKEFHVATGIYSKKLKKNMNCAQSLVVFCHLLWNVKFYVYLWIRSFRENSISETDIFLQNGEKKDAHKRGQTWK